LGLILRAKPPPLPEATVRQERAVEASLFDLFAEHGRKLKAMSQWLDEHRELIGLAAWRQGDRATGAGSDGLALRASQSNIVS
jgi:hypothetical protein